MQETFYQINIRLNHPDYMAKRVELLDKTEYLTQKLKKHGHTGRYGLHGLSCFSPKPDIATCIASTEHECGLPWLNNAIDKIKKEAVAERMDAKIQIGKRIREFNKLQTDDEKRAFVKETKKEFNLGKVNITSFVEVMEDKRDNQLISSDDFDVREMFIEPIKPSKQTLTVEKRYNDNITASEKKKINEYLIYKFGATTRAGEKSEWVSWTEIMDGKTARAKRLRENFELD